MKIPQHTSTSLIPFPEDPRWVNAVYAGYMTKEGSFFKNWKKRFFILTAEGDLFYFKKIGVSVLYSYRRSHLNILKFPNF